MKRGRIQAKDVPTAPVVAFLLAQKGRWCTWGAGGHGMPTVADAMPLGTPAKVQLAKMRSLIGRKLDNGMAIDGCPCGCRGDFRVEKPGIYSPSRPGTAIVTAIDHEAGTVTMRAEASK